MPSKLGSDGRSRRWYLAENSWLIQKEVQAGERVETFKHVREMANASGNQDLFSGHQVKTTPGDEIPKVGATFKVQGSIDVSKDIGEDLPEKLDYFVSDDTVVVLVDGEVRPVDLLAKTL